MDGGRRADGRGRPAGTENEAPLLPPEDTGEAVGLGPANLTITVGFGPSLFDDRFGLAGERPAALRPIPRLPADELDPKISNGDLCIQACANDPQVAFHAVRNMTKIAQGVAVMRWCQLGFGKTSRTGADQQTPRNLMGFKDGTNNILNDDAEALEQFVWVGDEAPEWMRGGSYLVSRRIRMLIEPWDRTFLEEQEDVFGRLKESGAPIGGSAEKETVDLEAKGADGNFEIPARRPHQAGEPGQQRRRQDPPPRLLVHRRLRRHPRPARRRPVLHLLPEGPGQAVRPDPGAARGQRSRSTSTSSTPAAPCSRSRPGSAPRATTTARA